MWEPQPHDEDILEEAIRRTGLDPRKSQSEADLVTPGESEAADTQLAEQSKEVRKLNRQDLKDQLQNELDTIKEKLDGEERRNALAEFRKKAKSLGFVAKKKTQPVEGVSEENLPFSSRYHDLQHDFYSAIHQNYYGRKTAKRGAITK
jgi:hypothetical protein